MGVLRRQLGHTELGDDTPRRVVDEVVPLGGPHEGGELCDVREREEVVVVAEERLPLLAVLAPLRGPQRDEVTRGQGQPDRDDVTCHAPEDSRDG